MGEGPPKTVGIGVTYSDFMVIVAGVEGEEAEKTRTLSRAQAIRPCTDHDVQSGPWGSHFRKMGNKAELGLSCSSSSLWALPRFAEV